METTQLAYDESLFYPHSAMILKPNLENLKIKCYHTVLFILSVVLAVVDLGTDIAVCVTYKKQGQTSEFAASLTIIIFAILVTSFVAIFWKRREKNKTTRCDVCCVAVGGALRYDMKMAAYCIKKYCCCNLFKKGKGSKHEEKLQAESFYMKVLDGLLEKGPQLILQMFVITVQATTISFAQAISPGFSFASFLWLLTTYQYFAELESPKQTWKMRFAMFIYNGCLVAARFGAIIFFMKRFRLWVIAVIAAHMVVHGVITQLTAIFTKKDVFEDDEETNNKARKKSSIVNQLYYCLQMFGLCFMNVLIFISPRGYKSPRFRVLFSFVWYLVVYSVENTILILLYHKFKDEESSYDIKILALVIAGSFIGSAIRFLAQWRSLS